MNQLKGADKIEWQIFALNVLKCWNDEKFDDPVGSCWPKADAPEWKIDQYTFAVKI